MNKVVFDVETIGCLEEWQKQDVYASCEAPSNIKDPAKIQAAISKKFKAKVERAALDPWMGRVRVITACNISNESRPVMHWASEEDEFSVLVGFRDWLASLAGGYLVIGFNIARFDIPFLNVRMMKHQIPWRTPFPAHQRDYKRYFDLMTVLDGHKLDHWLKIFGLPPKIADGADTLTMSLEDTVEYAVSEMTSMVQLTDLMSGCLNISDLQ